MSLIQLKMFFANVDKIVYTLITIVYKLIEMLPSFDVFANGNAIGDFTSRIYTILGIFMLFKVSFSFINYLIDPDKFSDKQTGFSKIIVNIILVFVMLMSTPWAFSILRNFQNAILSENIIPNFILGNDGNSDTTKELYWDENCENPIYVKGNGNYIALMLFRPFYQYADGFKDSVGDNAEQLLEIGSSAMQGTSQEQQNDKIVDEKRKNGVLCSFSTTEYQTVDTMLDSMVFLYPQNKVWGEISDIASLLALFPVSDLATIFGAKFQVNYMFLISTIFGIIMLGLFISFALDIAMRSIKFSFLQIIAPIPIISYIDPDKNKHKMFNNWLQEVGKTWASLFIRIGSIYLIIYIIELLNMSEIGAQKYWHWCCLFIILGALIFAKKLPSLIESLLGIKLEGGMFEINPLKKLKNEALGGKQVANATMGAVGAGVGMAGSAIAHGLAYNANRKKLNAEQSKLDKIKGDARTRRMQGVQNYMNAKNSMMAEQSKLNSLNNLKAKNDHDKIVAARRGDSGLLAALGTRGAELDNQINKQQINLSSAKTNLDNVRKEALKAAEAEKIKVSEQQGKYDELKNKKINSHPFTSAVGEIGRGFASGAKNAYQADTLNVGKIISAGLKGTEEAAIKRNYREDFSIRDEIAGNIASFAKIKNESGTSSEVDEAIKKLKNQLTRDTSKLDQLGRVLTDSINSVSKNAKSEATQIAKIDKEQFINRYNSYEKYKNTHDDTNLSKEEFDNILEAIKAIISTQNSLDKITKDIKKYEKIQESENKKGKN